MAGNRTRISARLQPVAAALASAPGSASISTVLASITGSSSPVIRPSTTSTITTTATASTTSRPRRSRTPRDSHRAANATTSGQPESEQGLAASTTDVTSPSPLPAAPVPIVDATSSIQEGAHTRDNDLISIGTEALPTSVSTAVTLVAIEPIASSDQSNNSANIVNPEPDAVSIATVATSFPTPAMGKPGSFSAPIESSAASSSTTTD
ncbi:hypothetical protein BGZ97_011991, partial [Linnemannia gamsii]